MSDRDFNSPAASSKREELEELIAAKKDKGGASQTEAKHFTETWVAYVETVGINDETVGMLYDGFQFAAGEPFYRYVERAHNGNAYATLFSSKSTIKNEQGLALRVAVNLLALELPAPTSDNSVRLIAHAIPGLSKNRDGKAFGNLGRSIGRILVKPLARKSIDPGISIDRKDASAVLSVLRSPLEAFATRAKARSVESTAAMQLIAWLEGQSGRRENGGAEGQEGNSTATANGTATNEAAKPALSDEEAKAKEARREARRSVNERPVRITRVLPTAGETVQSSNTSSGASTAEGATSSKDRKATKQEAVDSPIDIDAVLSFLTTYRREHERLSDSNERLRNEKRSASLRASNAEQSLRDAQREIGRLQEQVARFSERNAALQSEVASLRESNATLSGDLSAAEEMLGMIDRRDSRQADESTKRLASELRVEYRDFLDAADLPMDADLGENMREQLKNVFGILTSNGIKL